MEKPYLNLQFKYHGFLPSSNENEDFEFRVFFFPNINQIS